MWLTIVLSFGFYIGWCCGQMSAIVGMLMIPKTCAYVWTIADGYNAARRLRTAE